METCQVYPYLSNFDVFLPIAVINDSGWGGMNCASCAAKIYDWVFPKETCLLSEFSFSHPKKEAELFFIEKQSGKVELEPNKFRDLVVLLLFCTFWCYVDCVDLFFWMAIGCTWAICLSSYRTAQDSKLANAESVILSVWHKCLPGPPFQLVPFNYSHLVLFSTKCLFPIFRSMVFFSKPTWKVAGKYVSSCIVYIHTFPDITILHPAFWCLKAPARCMMLPSDQARNALFS